MPSEVPTLSVYSRKRRMFCITSSYLALTRMDSNVSLVTPSIDRLMAIGSLARAASTRALYVVPLVVTWQNGVRFSSPSMSQTR